MSRFPETRLGTAAAIAAILAGAALLTALLIRIVEALGLDLSRV